MEHSVKNYSGETPSEELGITIKGDNKWLPLMKKALQYKKAKEEGRE